MASVSSRQRVFQPPEPIAIIGVGCRLPGGANDPEKFWRLLRDGVDAITDVPSDRWDLGTYFDPDPSKRGKMYVRHGGFIKDIAGFDAEFFGISPREAVRMDPQHRLLLEVAFESLEDAGLLLSRLAGSSTGVFVGISTQDYGALQFADPRLIDPYTNIGLGMCIAANRISHAFDLRGPSLAVDTACSSSLVAVHLACQSIWRGESKLALAGGVNVLLRPEPTIGFSKASMLSPDGRCRSFSARANGYVRSEGAGLIVLKLLAEARSDNDHIYALIRGTATNQDGRTPGISVPNVSAQQSLVEECCRLGGVDPREVHYVEAHGTGTLVGDPIEAQALGAVFGSSRRAGKTCVIGSVKSNIGHLEAASGIAGLLKTALCLKHGELVPNLHYELPNPAIPFHQLKLRVSTSAEPWPEPARKRYACVNSFGFGGTNASVILQAATPIATSGANRSSLNNSPMLLLISARSKHGLHALATSYRALLTDTARAQVSFADVCQASALRREHHDHRLAIVAAAATTAVECLDTFLAGEKRSDMSSGRRIPNRSPKLVFVFSGMGAQRWDMGRELLREDSLFLSSMNRCDSLFRERMNVSLLEELARPEEESRIHRTDVAQAAIFALQIGLLERLRAFGVVPNAVVGHSLGEVAAAHCAGALSLEDAVCIVAQRARLLMRLAGHGGMLAVGLSSSEAQALATDTGGSVVVAAINSPSGSTLSGPRKELEAIAARLAEAGIYSRMLPVDVPYHSPQIDPLGDEFRQGIAGIRQCRTTRPFYSACLAAQVEGVDLDPDYWWAVMRHPVRFAEAVDKLAHTGHSIFLEISAHPILSAYVMETAVGNDEAPKVIPTLRRAEPERAALLAAIGKLYTSDVPVSWESVFEQKHFFSCLPRYPWHHENYWLETDTSRRTRLGERVHPLLGFAEDTPFLAWTNQLDQRTCTYLYDHKINDAAVYPAAAYLEMGLAAARETYGPGSYSLEDVEILRALFLPKGDPPRVQLMLDREKVAFQVYSRPETDSGTWLLHARGRLRALTERSDEQTIALDTLRNGCPLNINQTDVYARFESLGLFYGPIFRGVRQLWVGEKQTLAEIEAPSDINATDYVIHPAVLDACLQSAIPLASCVDNNRAGVYVPIRIDRVHFIAAGNKRLFCNARIVETTATDIVVNLIITSPDGVVLCRVWGLRCRHVAGAGARQERPIDDYLYTYRWRSKNRGGQHGRRVPAGLRGPEEILPTLRQHAIDLSERFDRGHYYKIMQPRFHDLALGCISDALRRLGWNPKPGERVECTSLANALQIVPEYQPLLARMLDIMTDAGVLERADGDWRVVYSPPTVDPESLWRELMREFPAYLAEMTLVLRCGRSYPEVLRGELNPLEVLFPSAALTATEHFYQDSPSYRVYNLLVQRACDLILRDLTQHHTVRILELGGGTGGLTSYVLPKVQMRQTEYMFTDVSQLLLRNAEQKFCSYPFVQYQTLDIGDDPIAQGFEDHSYDLILASDVLHATPDLQRTLANIKRLLTSEGQLILLEGTTTPLWAILIFGLLKGWWMFRADGLREKDPWMSKENWMRLLEETGFSQVSAVSDTNAQPLHSVLLAQGPRLPEQRAERPAPRDYPQTWIIFADHQGVADALAAVLRERGDRVMLAFHAESYRQERENVFGLRAEKKEMQALMQGFPAFERWAGVVYLWGLDLPSTTDMTSGQLAASYEYSCIGALNLAQAVIALDLPQLPNIWWVTRGAQFVDGQIQVRSVAQSTLWGLGRVVNNELPSTSCKLVDLGDGSAELQARSLLDEMCAEDDGETEIALRDGARFVHRLNRISLNDLQEDVTPTRPAVGVCQRLEVVTPGVLDTLTFRCHPRRPPDPEEVEIEVYATGLNFKDVMAVMGLLPRDVVNDAYTGDALGMECAGRIVSVGAAVSDLRVGDDVIAFGSGAFATFLTTHVQFVARIPQGLSYEAAATIPVAYLTAHYALEHLARLRDGERVLIHAASGGIGIAAVQLASRVGAEIFATAGTDEKRELLRALGIRHVMNSRTLDFADQIMEITKGEGVDVVLNALPGQFITKSLSVLGSYGRFVEIGKVDIYSDSLLGLRPFRRNLSFFALDLDRVCGERPQLARSLLERVVRMFADGSLVPPPHRVFSVSQRINAFRHMAQAKHVGKVVVSWDDPSLAHRHRDPELRLRSDGTYLITGGLGGFGLVTAQWLVDKGARHIVLVNRGSEIDATKRDLLKSLGEVAQVSVLRGDVSNRSELTALLQNVRQTMPPLRGVFHAAMVLDDGFLHELDSERMQAVLAPKVEGAWNLHLQTLNESLDHFVLFSSIASIIGNARQGNYIAANAFLDALTEHRRSMGLPGLTVNWGVVRDVGFVARNPDIQTSLEQLYGIKPMVPGKLLEILGELMRVGASQAAVADLNWKQLTEKGIVRDSPVFSHLIDQSHLPSNISSAQKIHISAIMATDAKDRPRVLATIICTQLAEVLRTEAAKIDVAQPLVNLGLDSLMAVELRSMLRDGFGVDVPPAKFLEGISVGGLASFINAKIGGKVTAPVSESSQLDSDGMQAIYGPLDFAEGESGNGI